MTCSELLHPAHAAALAMVNGPKHPHSRQVRAKILTAVLREADLQGRLEQSLHTLLALPMAGGMLSGCVMSTSTSCTRLEASAGSKP